MLEPGFYWAKWECLDSPTIIYVFFGGEEFVTYSNDILRIKDFEEFKCEGPLEYPKSF